MEGKPGLLSRLPKGLDRPASRKSRPLYVGVKRSYLEISNFLSELRSTAVSQNLRPVVGDLHNWVDNLRLLFYNSVIYIRYAGVVKLVDAEDSKSSDPCGRVGSIPTSGTRNMKGLAILVVSPFFHGYNEKVSVSQNGTLQRRGLYMSLGMALKSPFLSCHPSR